ncbi:MAG: NAD(P)-dependent oxidoreductase [Cellvibrionaceae bacterium]|nr:NAD(P)-dependent oxidoreductase [Cellvibrionaceae bacterium]
MAKKIVLTCARSLFSEHLIEALEQEPFTLEVWQDFDNGLAQLPNSGADLLINSLPFCVGDDLGRRAQLNNDSKALAEQCEQLSIPLIQLSNYEVFGGENLTIYREDDEPSPLSAYGQALWEAERAVQLHCSQHLIFRLSWLVCSHGHGILTDLLERLSGSEPVRVSAARRASPTFMDDASRVLVAIIKQVFSGAQNWGVYHYASSDPCNELELAQVLREVMQALGYPVAELREDDSGVQYPSAVMGCLITRDDFGVQQRSWRQRLETRVKAYMDSRPA